MTNEAETKDTSAFILQKNVVLCRSGIQIYHRSEVDYLICDNNKPKVEKEWYREYRPPNVVVAAAGLCKSLPVTREHPNDFVNPKNVNQLMGGVTDNAVEVVALTGESNGEIGLKSSITFYSQELFDYYKECNREVSLGYSCEKHFVDNPEEVGYDIILDKITDVNHLAITAAGRGGSDVAIIDSIKKQGERQMKTREFALFCKDERACEPCAEIFEKSFAVGDSKKVLDSLKFYPDSAEKQILTDFICDSFEFPEVTKKNMVAIKEKINAMFDSLCSMTDSKEENEAYEEQKDSEEEKEDKKDEKTEDSEEKSEDSCDKEEKAEDSDEESDKKDEKTEDSNEKVLKKIIKEVLEEMKVSVTDSVKDSLVDEKAGGLVLDTGNVTVSDNEYSDYLK